jgi:hypothetical protein
MPKPASITLPDELHAAIQDEADRAELSFNELTVQLLRTALNRPDVPAGFFDAPHITISQLAVEQGVSPVEDLSTLAADFWPQDERIDDFIDTLKTWRREKHEQHD